MPTRPEELHPALTAAYNAGDLDGMLALYDPQAVFVIKPGRVTDGPAELRAALQRLDTGCSPSTTASPTTEAPARPHALLRSR